ncbi:MAG: FHA domain-containing protein [Melioribacteraceae bacterium]|nr:FHA domain-containing protein [Melioribacteraceae bacterium]MCF8355930.1 FHA domain-containing protein [Melioribacteraceae bacterium]MCF8395470.1 FHA domain-containing protein [Melioribacteraceae bacterium]MCF8420776.1 FHA domain-containing protein [Melioribacteraceae bacterium]
MICPKCKADIEDDSFFCDQCGEEIFICTKCGKPGKGKRCTADGSPLVSAKDKSQTPDTVTEKTSQSKPADTKAAPPPAPKPAPPQPSPASPQPSPGQNIPELKLINNAIGANFTLNDGDIIGRKTGRFTGIFAQYKQISSKHAQISYDSQRGWCITDLDSSNGTKYNGQKLQPNLSQPISDKSYILLANIEFYVQITGMEIEDTEKTVRI